MIDDSKRASDWLASRPAEPFRFAQDEQAALVALIRAVRADATRAAAAVVRKLIAEVNEDLEDDITDTVRKALDYAATKIEQEGRI